MERNWSIYFAQLCISFTMYFLNEKVTGYICHQRGKLRSDDMMCLVLLPPSLRLVHSNSNIQSRSSLNADLRLTRVLGRKLENYHVLSTASATLQRHKYYTTQVQNMSFKKIDSTRTRQVGTSWQYNIVLTWLNEHVRQIELQKSI